MTFTQSITTCLSKYATFSGTASRSEFWWFFLFTQLLFYGVIGFGILTDDQIYLDLYPPDSALDAILYMVMFGTLIPILAAGSRRLHDMGNSGWWQLLYLISVVPTPLHHFTFNGHHFFVNSWDWIVILLLMMMFATDTKDKDNRFKPKSRRSTS